ncbi:Zinc finger RING/FYVE/PHD-type protein [Dioscorea alata]|uniref:Zinc finger RING/FYVE/PHD-type protein n=1 Tax=Dioscorea alata TaxID=55571 RepID=A0ACB7V632_DIOAL|nr:Zinc finger RING/FYVE/PHD-type protein [Dioscorea alata]
MAAGFKKDDIIILRIDGEDLKEFSESPQFEPEMISIFSGMGSSNASLCQRITMALEQLTVEHGMPPSSDTWVFNNIIEPALQSLSLDQFLTVSQEIFLEEFRKLIDSITLRLQDKPVIVARNECIFDGSGIKKLLSDKAELNKMLEVVWRDLPADQTQKISDSLCVSLDRMADSANLPLCGTIPQVDTIVKEVLSTLNTTDQETLHEDEFKKTMTETLRHIMSRLEENPVFISAHSVVHEPMVTPFTESE